MLHQNQLVLHLSSHFQFQRRYYKTLSEPLLIQVVVNENYLVPEEDEYQNSRFLGKILDHLIVLVCNLFYRSALSIAVTTFFTNISTTIIIWLSNPPLSFLIDFESTKPD